MALSWTSYSPDVYVITTTEHRLHFPYQCICIKVTPFFFWVTYLLTSLHHSIYLKGNHKGRNIHCTHAFWSRTCDVGRWPAIPSEQHWEEEAADRRTQQAGNQDHSPAAAQKPALLSSGGWLKGVQTNYKSPNKNYITRG